jgi:hypothetical protein
MYFLWIPDQGKYLNDLEILTFDRSKRKVYKTLEIADAAATSYLEATGIKLEVSRIRPRR